MTATARTARMLASSVISVAIATQMLCAFARSNEIQVTNKAPAKELRVAGNIPLSGTIAAFCGRYPIGFFMGVEDACADLKVPRNKFLIDFQDNKGSPSQAVSILQKQMLDPLALYVSGVSPMSLAIAPQVSKLKIPHLFVAFDAFICREGVNRLRILPHYKIEGPVYVDYAKKIGAKRVFIIYNINPGYEREFVNIVEPGLKAAGIRYKKELFEFDNRDFRSIVLRAAEYKPDLIMIGGFSGHIYSLLGALRSYGLLNKSKVLCTLDFIDLLYNGTSKNELIGIPFIAPQFEISGSSPEAKEWRQRYQKRTSRAPSYIEAYAYDTGRIIVAAYKRYGDVSTSSIRSVMPFRGVTGEIYLDSDGDLKAKLAVAEVKPDGNVTWK